MNFSPGRSLIDRDRRATASQYRRWHALQTEAGHLPPLRVQPKRIVRGGGEMIRPRLPQEMLSGLGRGARTARRLRLRCGVHMAADEPSANAATGPEGDLRDRA